MDLNDLLKKQTVRVESLGREVEIRELSHGANIRVIKSHQDGDGLAEAWTVKWGLSLDESAEEVVDMFSTKMISELANLIIDISDVNTPEDAEKN